MRGRAIGRRHYRAPRPVDRPGGPAAAPVASAAVRTETTRRPTGAWSLVEAEPADRRRRARGRPTPAWSLVREVLQLRRPLPADPAPPLDVRPFRPGRRRRGVPRGQQPGVRWHPDQAGWTADDLRAAARPSRGSTPRASCSTSATGASPGSAGPRSTRHRRRPGARRDLRDRRRPRLHRPRAWAGRSPSPGLDHLAGQGLTVGMLYVEAANDPRRPGSTTPSASRSTTPTPASPDLPPSRAVG